MVRWKITLIKDFAIAQSDGQVRKFQLNIADARWS
jgi:hypothetical protein